MPKLVEVGPVGSMMLPGQSAQEERQEAPASRRARGKERAMQVLPPLETDNAMAWRIQE